jgi:hypothetical protein
MKTQETLNNKVVENFIKCWKLTVIFDMVSDSVGLRMIYSGSFGRKFH